MTQAAQPATAQTRLASEMWDSSYPGEAPAKDAVGEFLFIDQADRDRAIREIRAAEEEARQ